MRSWTVGSLCAGIAIAGCTETPGYFPPCVYNAACPSEDGGEAGTGDADADVETGDPVLDSPSSTQ